MKYDVFESTVPSQYFASKRCRDARMAGKTSLADAAKTFWPDLAEEELATLHETILDQLESGGFHYVLVAQRFVPLWRRTCSVFGEWGSGIRVENCPKAIDTKVFLTYSCE